MLIDFHCHTKAVKDGEASSRNIPNAKYFCEQVKNANVKMVAITNHNSFDFKQFNEVQKEAKDEIIIFPGIEFDVIGENKERGHIVFFYDNTKVDEFNKQIKELLGDKNANSFAIKIDEFISFANKLNTGIIMAHYHKIDALDEKSLLKIKNGLDNKFRFFFEPSNYRTLGIMINNNFRVLMGSDIQDWSNYQEQKFASIKLDIDSYDMLFRFIKKDTEVVESVLNKLKYEKIPVSYSRDRKKEICFYQDVNIIFGEKGTGKTQTLDEVKQYFNGLNNSVSYYSPQKASDRMKEKLLISQDERKSSFYNIDTRKSELDFLKNWESTKITKFDDYREHIRTASLNANKVKMQILNITDEEFSEGKSNLEETKKHLRLVEQLENIIQEIAPSVYLKDTELDNFNDSFNKLHERILQRHKEEFANSFGIVLAKNFINTMKEITDKNTDSKSLPSTTGFALYAKLLFRTSIDVDKILSIENKSIVDKPEFIGVLDNGKKLYRRKKVQGLSKDSKAADGFEQIMNLRQIRNALVDIKKHIFDIKLVDCIKDYKDSIACFGDFNIDAMIGVSKYFTLEDGKKYIPSTGEETMIALDETLNEESDVYILDEPEKSLGNGYINDIIVERINYLAKLKKTIVIVTHNANIAIRTLPYQTILKLYDGDYATYVGSLYSGVLKDLDSGKTKDWRVESIRILEGGKDAFNERGDIYAQ